MRALEDILANDTHLRECCGASFYLSHYLDLTFVTAASDLLMRAADNKSLDLLFDEFLITTYHQGRFKRVALSHLFNFDMNENTARVGDVRIERVDQTTIPRILGEPGIFSFLHPSGIGNFFVVAEERWSKQLDVPWLNEKHVRALAFAQVLQYFKDGVVHVAYTVPYFLPVWVNTIRRGGLFFLGTPRREAYEDGKKRYTLSKDEINVLSDWWKAVTSPKIAAMLADTKSKLRQTIYRAGTYYEASHTRQSSAERLIALAISLESLFSPTDTGEFTFRISLGAAQFLGRTAEERQTIFKGVREMYSRRSALFHGAYDVAKYDAGTFVTADGVDTWSSWIRRAICGFVALYLAGKKERETVIKDINAAAIDSSVGDKLRASSSLETILLSRIS